MSRCKGSSARGSRTAGATTGSRALTARDPDGVIEALADLRRRGPVADDGYRDRRHATAPTGASPRTPPPTPTATSRSTSSSSPAGPTRPTTGPTSPGRGTSTRRCGPSPRPASTSTTSTRTRGGQRVREAYGANYARLAALKRRVGPGQRLPRQPEHRPGVVGRWRTSWRPSRTDPPVKRRSAAACALPWQVKSPTVSSPFSVAVTDDEFG